MGESSSPLPARPPGPFGPVIELLPKDQRLESVEQHTPVWDAIERMTESDYSQLPVVEDGIVVGLVSWRSLGKHVGKMQSDPALLADLTVRDCVVKVPFLSAEDYIDTGVDWTNVDCLLVGTPENVVGLLAIYDVVGRLTDFGEAFFLIHEVEHLLREMITDAVRIPRLRELLAAMSMPPGVHRQPEALTDLTFAMYGTLVCSKKRWPEFEGMFFGDRITMNDAIARIAKIRNVVFHFKRPVTVEDVDELRRFRDRLNEQRVYFFRSNPSEIDILAS